jgi:transcriptional regulator with XRE-family HTH domain
MTAAQRSLWSELRSRLRRATKSRGAQAALARKFNVSTAAVAQWLTGASAPTAETTLQLLEWVTAEEAQSKQKKRAGSGSTLPALKARKSKSTRNEKAKSGP